MCSSIIIQTLLALLLLKWSEDHASLRVVLRLVNNQDLGQSQVFTADQVSSINTFSGVAIVQAEDILTQQIFYELFLRELRKM